LNIVTVSAREQELSRSLELHQAIESGDNEKVISLIQSGIDINSRNRENGTPLHTAISMKNKDITLLLIDKYYADVNLANNYNETPLHLAARSGEKEIVEKLIEKGANVNSLNRYSDNALSLSREAGFTEITDILLKNGAKEPEQVIEENRINDLEMGNEINYETPVGEQENLFIAENTQSNVINDLLADPNEIRARIKAIEGLEKSIEGISTKSKLGIRRWKQVRIDNKATLVNNVQRQIQEEIKFIQKLATEEKAEKTAKAADDLLKVKRNRTPKIVREIKDQVQEQPQTRTSSRSRGRSTRGSGRTSTQNSGYNERRGRRGSTSSSRYAADEENVNQQQVDPEEQNEINQWVQADVQDYDSKVTLFTAINQQVMNEFGLIRQESEQEEATKTTAAIDGLLLARKMRYDELNIYIQERKAKLEEQQQQEDVQTSRNRGGRSNEMGQDNQSSGRRRRR
jgi:hypothetical protein